MSSTEKKFSFAKPGGSAALPVEDIKPTTSTENAAPGDTPPSQLPATQQTYQPPAFFDGSEDEAFDVADQRLPRLNIVQKSSKSEWLEHGVFSLLLKGAVRIAKKDQPFRFIVAGARPKVYIEKLPYRPGSSERARVAHSLDEVVKFGGTDSWRFSKENAASGSTKPWFMPSVTLALLVEKPADCPAEEEAHFAYVVGDKAYAAALLSVKSTNYDSVYIFLASERRGLLSKGFASRYINGTVSAKTFKSGESGVFSLSYGPETPQEIRDLADKIVKGN